jgi:hypothetical protein
MASNQSPLFSRRKKARSVGGRKTKEAICAVASRWEAAAWGISCPDTWNSCTAKSAMARGSDPVLQRCRTAAPLHPETPAPATERHGRGSNRRRGTEPDKPRCGSHRLAAAVHRPGHRCWLIALATNSSCEPSTRYSSTLIELPGQPCAASKTCVVKRPIDSARLPAWSSQTSRLPKSVEKETAPIRSTKSCGERLIKTLFKKIVHNKNDIFNITPAIRGFPRRSLPATMHISIEPFNPLADWSGRFLAGYVLNSKR